MVETSKIRLSIYFYRDDEVWFAIIVNNKMQRGWTIVADDLKENNISSWVVDHGNDSKTHKSISISVVVYIKKWFYSL
jgi:hypothetical protein